MNINDFHEKAGPWIERIAVAFWAILALACITAIVGAIFYL